MSFKWDTNDQVKRSEEEEEKDLNNNSKKPNYSYLNTYSESYSLEVNETRREELFFRSDKEILVKIIDHEQESSLVLLHTTVYIINISYLGFNWTIKRRFKNFLKLYETYALFKAKLNIKNVAVTAHMHANSALFHNTNSAQENVSNLTPNDTKHSKFKPSDHFKLIYQSIASDFDQAKIILEKFLQDVLDHKTFRNHNETLKFFELSHLSFIADLGDKNKEGLIKKHSSNIACCYSINFNFFWDTRWLIIKDTWIGYLNPKTGLINLVMLVDHGFRVTNGLQNTGTRHGLLIENLSRTVLFKCYSEKYAHEWRLAIQNMALNTGEKFFNIQRFGSFAPIRESSLVKWFVDGSDYMESVADSIESAKEEIFITGFFLSPEIYLKRPVIVGDKWRLDKLLQRKAEEGVKVYILIYKEIELTLPINSAYSKRILSLTHKNIKVLRHPDHINEPNQFFTIMWAHHEKLVVIDQSVAYFGGIDLCYGRWDNHLHKLTDMGSVLPSNLSTTVNLNLNHKNNQETVSFFPVDDKSSSKSKENSVRLLGFKARDSNFSFEITSQTIKSQPTITNTRLTRINLDEQIADERLSIIKNKFVQYESFEDHDLDLINNNKNFYRIFSTPGSSFDQVLPKKENDSDHEDLGVKIFSKSSLKRSKSLDMSLSANCANNLSHSISDSSGLTLTNKDLYLNKKIKNIKNSIREYGEIPILNKIKKIKQFKDNFKKYKLKFPHYNDNSSDLNSSVDQYDEEINRSFEPSSAEFILNNLQGSTKYWIGKDYCNFIYRDVKEVHSPFKDSIDRSSIPRMPWHDVGGCVCGPAARDIARHFIQRWNYIKMKKVRNNPNYVNLVPKCYKNFNIPPSLVSKCSNCSVQVLRSVSNWSAGISKTEMSIHEAMKYLIQTSKHYVYIENQFFISLINDNSVINQIAECLFERIVRAHKEKASFKVYVFLPLIPGYEGEYGKSSGVLLHAITHYNNSSINGLIKRLADSSIEALNYLCFFSMRTWSELNGKLVTELIYVHSKLMIVDDRACIIGSANINDRSLLGNRDSEVALLVEDTQFVNGLLNKRQSEVGRFCSTLRQRLFKEFLGEFPNNNSFFINTTESNRKQSIISESRSESIDVTDPCSDEFYKQVLLKYAAHNSRIYDVVFKTIPCDYVSNFQQLKEYQKQSCLSQKNFNESLNELNKIKGYIVLYPYRFLCFEDLTPPLGTKEKLMPTTLWT